MLPENIVSELAADDRIAGSAAARVFARQAKRAYFTVKSHGDECRIRVYVLSGGNLYGVDQLLSEPELTELGCDRTPFAHSRTGGPGGIVKTAIDRRTEYAIAQTVLNILGREDLRPTVL